MVYGPGGYRFWGFLETRSRCHGLGVDRHSSRDSSILEILKGVEQPQLRVRPPVREVILAAHDRFTRTQPNLRSLGRLKRIWERIWTLFQRTCLNYLRRHWYTLISSSVFVLKRIVALALAKLEYPGQLKLVPSRSERRDKEPFTPFSTAFRPLRPLQPWLFHQAQTEIDNSPNPAI